MEKILEGEREGISARVTSAYLDNFEFIEDSLAGKECINGKYGSDLGEQ